MRIRLTFENSILILVTFFAIVGVYWSHTLLAPNRGVASIYEANLGDACAKKMLEVKWVEPERKKDKFPEQLQQTITEAFKVCLGSYIRIKTISPVGNEEKAVEFFENIYTQLDIPHKRFYVPNLSVEDGDDRVNLVATLSTDRSSVYKWNEAKDKKSIILLNHMDVVDANPQQWEKPELTWSGEVAPSEKDPSGDFIWGRGALDMKGIGITQMINLWLLKQRDIKLKRDIHFLAVADEEANGSGAIGALELMQQGEELEALASASLVLNEGGGGIKDTPSPGFDLFLLATEEKGGAWLNFELDDPIELLKDLYKAKMMMIDERITKSDARIRGHDCELTKVVTPQAKVNVVASKIIAEFRCKEGFQTPYLFESVFKHNFEGVKTTAVQNGKNTVVTIETASSSHGSTGINESAVDAFVMGLYHLNILDIRKKKKNPSYFSYIQTAATKGLIKGLRKSNFLLNMISRLSFIPFFRTLILKEVENSFGLDGLFRTTCQFSAFNFNKDNNGKSNALVDCRLLHSAIKHKNSKNHAKDFIDQLYKTIKDDELKINLISGWNVSYSPVTNKDFKMITKTMNALSRKKEKDRKQKTIAAPFLFPAGTDSTWFRNPFSAGVDGMEPIPAYGFFPLYMTEELLATFHGSNERFPINEIPGTVERYILVLSKLAKRSDLNIINRAQTSFKEIKDKKLIKKLERQNTGKMVKELKQEYSEQINVVLSK